MRLFRRHVEPPPSLLKQRPSEATLARIRAEKELEATRAETPRYEALAKRLKAARERNNFAAAFKHSIQGGSSG